MKTTQEILKQAKEAKIQLSVLSKEIKNKVLIKISENILKFAYEILEANKIDVEKARQSLSETMLDRLLLNEERLKKMAESVLDVVLLDKCPLSLITRSFSILGYGPSINITSS